MKDKIIEILSEKINSDLVFDLVESYTSVKNSHILGDDEGAISKSGKFVENVFRVLKFIRTGRILKEIKQREFNSISEELINSDSSKFSDSIRILIPKISLSLIYETRNKSGAVHVKEINPDFIDGKFVVGACDWIMAEFLRLYHLRDPKIVSEFIRNVIKEFVPIIQIVGDEKFVTAKLDCPDEILIRLYDSENGLTQKELCSSMQQHFTRQKISAGLIKLGKERMIFPLSNNTFVISDTSRNYVKNLISSFQA